MEWFTAHVTEISGSCGAILVVWQLFAKIDRAIIAHLDDRFATRQDFDRLEAKVDTVVNVVLRDNQRRRLDQ